MANSKHLKMLHLNIQYIRDKIDLINIFLQTEQPDLVVFTEHGLKADELQAINFQDYKILSEFSRSEHKSSGGSVILCKYGINVNMLNVNRFSKEMSLELSGAEIVLNNSDKILLFGIYRPPHYTNVNMFFNLFYQLLSNYLSINKKLCIIVGDLNINWLVTSSETNRLHDLMREFNLKQFVNSPTRESSSSSTLIDHVLSNINADMLQVDVVGTGLSDHFAQFITVTLHNTSAKITRSGQSIVTAPNTRPENLRTLNYLLEKEPWDSLNNHSSAGDKFNCFINIFNHYFSIACPMKSKLNVKRGGKLLWITKGIIISSRKLKELDFRKKTNKTKDFLDYYKKYRKIYRNVIKVAKAAHLYERLSRTDNLGKEAWTIIDQDRNKKSVLLPENMPNPEVLNTYFANVGKQKSSIRTEPPVQSQSEKTCPSTLMLTPTDPREIYKIIMNLKNSNASGYDGITHKLVRQCANAICIPLCNIINSSLMEGLFPQEMKQAIVRPVYKDGDTSSPENYRPIANVSTFSKIFEHVFANRLLNFLFHQNLLCKEQYGFVRGKNTTNAMVAFATNAIDALDKKFKSVGVFLDLQKAFDCLDHEVLFDKLSRLGVRGAALSWIESFLVNRTQSVQVKNVISNKLKLNFGIPQGSVLGPILFILYTNSLTLNFPDLHITMYADDIALLFQGKSLENLEINCFLQLTKLFQYLNNNNLHVNPSKSKSISFSNHFSIDENPSIVMNEFELPLESDCKYLGLIFDNKFTWGKHIDTLCSKLTSELFLLSRYAQYQNYFLLRLIYNSMIESRLRYGIVLWGSASRKEFLRVFYLQKRAVRIIAGVRRRAPCKTFFQSLRILTLPSLYIYEMLLFYSFKGDSIQVGSDVHNYNTRSRDQHRQAIHRLQLTASLPQNMGPKLFNKLPQNIKIEYNPIRFKKLLHNYLLMKAFYSVGEYLSDT